MKCKAMNKILTLGLAAALVFCGLPMTAGAADDIEMQAGMPQLTVNADNATVIGFAGHEWVVIGDESSGVATGEADVVTLLLKKDDAGGGYGKTKFHDSSNEYSGSNLKTAMEGKVPSLTGGEYSLIIPRELVGGSGLWNSGENPDYDPDKVAGTAVNDAHFWPLSVYESRKLNSSVRQFGDFWWLRSPGLFPDYAAVVLAYGNVSAGGDYVISPYAIRPAFKLNLASVIFTSAASGGKSTAVGGSLVSVPQAPTGAIKLTVEDTSLAPSFDATLDKQAAKPGETVEVTYENAVFTDSRYFVSCVIVDDSGDITHYGKLSDQASGTVTFTVPDTLVNGDYTIRLFNEQCNGENCTDFASKPVNITLTVEGDTPQPTPPTPTPSTSTRRRSSGSGQTYTPPVAAAPQPFVVDAPKAKTALDEKGKSGAAKARIRHNGEIKVLAEAWAAFGKTPVDFDTADENGVQVRVTVPQPGKMTGDKLLSGYVKGSAVENRKAQFEKWFKNKLRVIHLDQQADWGQPVEIAAKLDLAGMNAKNLYFYSYDSKTSKYKRIDNPAYRIDENGFLHFTTEYAGDIIISDGMLERI